MLFSKKKDNGLSKEFMAEARAVKRRTTIRDFKHSYQLYLIILLPLIWLAIWKYYPMYGVQIAFRDYRAVDGILGSEWVGFKYFIKFFTSYSFKEIIINTISISFYTILAGFPFPIILALSLNSTLNVRFKKTVQMVTYMPHFISIVVLVGMIIQLTNVHIGLINIGIKALGGTAQDWLSKPELFSSIYVWTGIWQSCGWGTIIYLAALSGIDTGLHEAAMIDGANRAQRVWHIDLPGILPTAVIMLILNSGNIMTVGFEKIYLMQNDLNIDASEVISTYTYKIGLASTIPQYSYASAIGLFNSVVNLTMLIVVNQIAKKVSQTSIW